MFQFPFRRDELCNGVPNLDVIIKEYSFNSLFVGMSFAILLTLECYKCGHVVSIPFSSG